MRNGIYKNQIRYNVVFLKPRICICSALANAAKEFSEVAIRNYNLYQQCVKIHVLPTPGSFFSILAIVLYHVLNEVICEVEHIFTDLFCLLFGFPPIPFPFFPSFSTTSLLFICDMLSLVHKCQSGCLIYWNQYGWCREKGNSGQRNMEEHMFWWVTVSKWWARRQSLDPSVCENLFNRTILLDRLVPRDIHAWVPSFLWQRELILLFAGLEHPGLSWQPPHIHKGPCKRKTGRWWRVWDGSGNTEHEEGKESWAVVVSVTCQLDRTQNHMGFWASLQGLSWLP